MQARSTSTEISARKLIAVTMATILMLGSLSIAVQAESESAVNDRPLTRCQIEFLENNWHLNSGTGMHEIAPPDVVANDPRDPVIYRNMFEFMNANWHFDTGEVMVEE
jgi:hypothetical protein